jgi:hypothetical protein
MAPELWTGSEAVYSVSVDVYAWAMTVFLLWCKSNADIVFEDRGSPARRVGLAISLGKRFRRPPDVPDQWLAVITTFWVPEPLSQPSFKTICEIIARPEYPLEPGKEDDYMEYVNEL